MDRGNKLWDGYRFMNPGLSDRINQEKPKPRPRPALDEQRLAELDAALQNALDSRQPVKVRVFDPFEDRRYVGTIRGVAARRLVMETDRGPVRIPLSDVLDIEKE